MAKDTAPVTKVDFDVLRNDLAKWKTEIVGSISALRSDVGTLKADMTTVKNDMATLKAEFATFKDEVRRDLHFVSEQITILLSKTDEIGRITDVVCDQQDVLNDHHRRLQRLEGNASLVA